MNAAEALAIILPVLTVVTAILRAWQGWPVDSATDPPDVDPAEGSAGPQTGAQGANVNGHKFG